MRGARFIPVCPDAPAASIPHAYSSLQSHQPGIPRRESHTPVQVSPLFSQHRPVPPAYRRSSLLTTLSSPLPFHAHTYLVKVEHQIQLTHIPKERIQHLDEEVYRLQIRQLVVVCIDARAEEQPCVPPVHDLGHVAELDEVGLVLLVARRYEAVHLGRDWVSGHRVRSGDGD